ncbi:MAG: hypothetical protein ABFD82_24365 [Syntrophaceae bacterium]
MLPGNPEELENIKNECLRMSNRRALLSAAASVVPIPFTDIATDVVLLRKIMPRITERFGLSKEQVDGYDPQLAIFIYDAAKKLGTDVIGKYLTKELIVQILRKIGIRRLTANQAARYVPIIGQALSAGLSYTAMRLIIRSHINECHRVARAVMQRRNAQSFQYKPV